MESDNVSTANSYLMNGNYEGAIRELSKCLSSNDKDPQLYFLQGCCNLELGRVDEAIKLLTVAIEKGKDDAFVYLKRGVAHFQAEDFNKAMEDLVVAQSSTGVNEELISVCQNYQGKIKDSYN